MPAVMVLSVKTDPVGEFSNGITAAYPLTLIGTVLASPFCGSGSVEKRPLSSGRPASRSTARKNIYPKKPAAPKPEKPSLPTIVVPDSHRSKAPLIALILFTILLGALVGAAAYFFFFQ